MGLLFRRVGTAARATNKQRHPGLANRIALQGQVCVSHSALFFRLEEESV